MLNTPIGRTSWEGYFNSRNDLKNCNVKIYTTNDYLLLDKSNISEFNIVSRNSYVCDQIPTAECEVKVINFDSLSSTIKSYLLILDDVDNYFKIKYTVNGVETSFVRVVLKDYKISRKGDTASLTFGSPLSCLSKRAVNFYFGTTRSNTGSPASSGSNGVKFGLSRAELFPIRCLQNRQGIYYDYGSGTQDSEFSTKSLSTTADGNFNGINVIDDFEIDSDNPDKSSIELYGAISGGNIEDIEVTFTVPPSGQPVGATYINNGEDFVVKGFTVKTSGGGVYDNSFSVSIYNDKLYLGLLQSATRPAEGTELIWTIKRGTLSLKNPTDNSKTYIQSEGVPTLGSSDDSTLEYVRTYYGNNKIISFQCRIDPTLEPLDIVDIPIEGVNYRVALEEVSITFNGGFKGSIKGRILEMIVSMDFGVEPYKVFIDGNAWQFGGTVVGEFLDGTIKDITSQVTYSGYPSTPPSTGSHSYTVKVTYTQKSITKEKTYHIGYEEINAPVVSNVSADANELTLTVARPTGDSNQNHAILYLKNSLGESIEVIDFYHISSQSISISENDNPDIWDFIKDDVQNWLDNQLANDITCYFGVDSGNKTSDTVVLQANS